MGFSMSLRWFWRIGLAVLTVSGLALAGALVFSSRYIDFALLRMDRSIQRATAAQQLYQSLSDLGGKSCWAISLKVLITRSALL